MSWRPLSPCLIGGSCQAPSTSNATIAPGSSTCGSRREWRPTHSGHTRKTLGWKIQPSVLLKLIR